VYSSPLLANRISGSGFYPVQFQPNQLQQGKHMTNTRLTSWQRAASGLLPNVAVFVLSGVLLAMSSLCSFGQTLQVDRSFMAGTDGYVYDAAVQSDGKILIVGSFTHVNGVACSYVARLNADGTSDVSFNANASIVAANNFSEVDFVIINSNGGILLGGSDSGGSKIIRLNSSGYLDTSFSTIGLDGDLGAIALNGGYIYIGGYFSRSPNLRYYLRACFASNGWDDAYWFVNDDVWGTISCFADCNGLVFGGSFYSSGWPNLDSLGMYSSSFTADGWVMAMAKQLDGKLLVGGEFTALGNAPGGSHNFLGRFNADLSVDTGFHPNVSQAVGHVFAEDNGKILYSDGVLHRLNADGTPDNTFNPGVGGGVKKCVRLADGSLLAVGGFPSFGGQPHMNLARLYYPVSGPCFSAGTDGEIFDIAVQNDGKTVLAGVFTHINDTPCQHVARLNADASADTDFNANAATVTANNFLEVDYIAVDAGGGILVAGYDNDGGKVIRLYSNGTEDLSFSAIRFNGYMSALTVNGGYIYTGGNFTHSWGNYCMGAYLANGWEDAFGSLNERGNPGTISCFADKDGLLYGGLFDSYISGLGWCPSSLKADGWVMSMAKQPDGKLVVGGEFSTLGDEPSGSHNYLGRFNADGTVDNDFNPSLPQDHIVGLIFAQADGKILYSDGALNRLNVDGTADESFNAGINGWVNKFAQQAGGSILAVGSFSIFGGQTHLNIARLNYCPAPQLSVSDQAGYIRLSWTFPGTIVPEVEKFVILRSTAANGPFYPIATAGSSDRSFNDTTVAVNNTYYYVVVASYSDCLGTITTAASAAAGITHNAAPVANNISGLKACRGTPLNITLSGSDPYGLPLTYSIVTDPAHGTVSGGSGPNRIYTANNDYQGPDSFTYRVYNGHLYSSPATVSIDVNPLPVANGQFYVTDLTTPINITLTASSPCDLTYSIVSGPTLGSLSGEAPNLVYIPGATGQDTFTFMVNDGFHDPSQATVTIHVWPTLPSPIRLGFGTNSLSAGDDNSTGLINLPFTINFNGASYSALYVNNNGNVTFNRALRDWVTEPLVSLNTDIIAPFWEDVDTSLSPSEIVWYGNGFVNERKAFGVTWPYVDYFDVTRPGHISLFNAFQLVIIDRSDRASGDFDVEFNYAQIQWDTSPNAGSGVYARAGVASANTSSTFRTFEICGSGNSAAFLDSNPTTGLIHRSFNSSIQGRFVFRFHNGVPIELPPPVVALIAPTDGATVAGIINVSADVCSEAGVAGVQFKLDGANLGAEDTSAPYSISWDTRTVANGSHTLSATARDTAGSQSTATINVTVNNDLIPPTVSITSPANSSRVSGTITINASASDNEGVAGVQFKIDGVNLGAEDTTAPYSVSWDTRTAAHGTHTISATARDTAGNLATATITVTVDQPPTVSIKNPSDGQTVSGQVIIRATASDDVGVAGVQFKVNGANIGAEDTTPPYSAIWTAPSYYSIRTITAVARDTDGNLTTSAPITVYTQLQLRRP
jgi:uncharacterized delta-60 repeat protein